MTDNKYFSLSELVYVQRDTYDIEIGLVGKIISLIGSHHFEVQLHEPWQDVANDIADWEPVIIVSRHKIARVEAQP